MGSREVLRVLAGKWLLIVLSGLLGTALALIIAGVQAPKYSATADVFVTVTSGQSTGDLAQGSTFSQDQARNFAAVVTREIVLGPVIKQFGLNISLDDMRKNVEVDVPLNTSLIVIQVTDHNPAKAAAMANAIAGNLSTAVSELSPTVNDVKGAPVRADVIEAASVPDKPSSPNIPLYAVLGLLAGLVLAVAYLIVTELVVARVDTSDQVEALTGATVLASVPRDRKLSRHPIAVTALPLSLRAESIRSARTALKFLPGEHRTFVITSSVSGEGKSTTAANLAAAFAAEGLSTCLVEADLRRPRLEGVLDLTGGPGLSDIVVGQCQIDETLQTWGPDGLQVILVGTVPPNASELLGSVRGQEALQAISQRFDITIIDTPPLTAVTDAAIIGRIFGGVVMIVGGGKVHTAELRQAMGALAVADVPVLGTVLNLAKEDASRPYAYAYSDHSRRTGLRDLLPQGWRPVIKAAVAVIAAAAVLAITVLMTNSQVSAQPLDYVVPSAKPANASSATPAASPKAVFLGDSLVAGVGGDQGWTAGVAESLGWKEVNLGRGGTGYVTSSGVSGCSLAYCPTFVEMADQAIAAKPDIVVISGGQNDAGKSVSSAASQLFGTLHKALPKAQILVISPLWRSTPMPASMQTIAGELQAAAQASGVRYVEVGNPLQGHPEWFTSDGTHPTNAGYKKLSAAITAAIKKG